MSLLNELRTEKEWSQTVASLAARLAARDALIEQLTIQLEQERRTRESLQKEDSDRN